MSRLEFLVLCFVVVPIGVWLALPSSVFIQPVSYQFEAGEVRFVRETPLGGVVADWTQEVRTADGECPALSGRSVYQDQGLYEVVYHVQDQLAPCVETGDFIMDVRQIVLLGGVIPLRAVATRWRCFGDPVAHCERIG